MKQHEISFCTICHLYFYEYISMSRTVTTTALDFTCLHIFQLPCAYSNDKVILQIEVLQSS